MNTSCSDIHFQILKFSPASESQDLYLARDHSHFRQVEHKNERWEVILVNI